MKALFKRVTLVLSMMCVIAFASPLCLSANNLNGVNSSDSSGSNTNSDDTALSDYMRSYTPITQENMDRASTLASPIASFLGTLTGAIMIVVGAGIFFVTACDLCYIGLPFTRNFLNSQPAGGGGMEGRMPMCGGMPMGGGSQGRKWVSEEAIAAVAMAGGGGASAGGGMSMGGMGMGGMGGMGMGMPMGGGGAPQQSTKSTIFEYLKKRLFFIIIFAVASIVLMSSVLTDCGINIAELLLKIFNKINSSIANTQIN